MSQIWTTSGYARAPCGGQVAESERSCFISGAEKTQRVAWTTLSPCGVTFVWSLPNNWKASFLSNKKKKIVLWEIAFFFWKVRFFAPHGTVVFVMVEMKSDFAFVTVYSGDCQKLIRSLDGTWFQSQRLRVEHSHEYEGIEFCVWWVHGKINIIFNHSFQFLNATRHFKLLLRLYHQPYFGWEFLNGECGTPSTRD